MKLKGKATFELTNVETGEKRIIKEENMITNAFQYLLNSGGALGGSPYARCKDPYPGIGFYNMMSNKSDGYSSTYAREMIRRYTNGLLLFSGPLDENVDHIYVNADDPDLVGAGAEIAYIGSNSCGGSYNATESGPIENGYKHVWDFTTSQANGDIGCACLTTLMGASLGGGSGFNDNVTDWYGGFFSESDYDIGPLPVYFPPQLDYFQNPTSWGRGYIDLNRNIFIRPKEYYAFPRNYSTETAYVQNEEDINGNVVAKKVFDRSFLYKKSIDLDIFRFPYSNVSIFDNTNVNKSTSRKYQNKSVATTNNGYLSLKETVTVNMPKGLADIIPSDKLEASINTAYYWTTQFHFDEGFMYISFHIPTRDNSNGTGFASGDKIYVWKISMTTFESSWFVITNTTGRDITLYYSRNAHDTYFQWIITNEYTVLFSDPTNMAGNMWIIDNATGSTIKQVTYDDGGVFSKSSTQYCYFVRNNMIYFIEAGRDAVFGTMLILNLKTGIVKHSTSASQYRKYVHGTCTYGTKMPLVYYINTGNYNNNYSCMGYFIVDPNLLMTINNLEDVVTKTSAETMKVTYILTEEVEE